MRIFCPAIAVLRSCRSGGSGCVGPDEPVGPHGPGRRAAAGVAAARLRDLLDDLGDAAGADGAATLTDGEPEALLHGDRLDQLDRHLGVVTGHDHLGAAGQRHDAGHVRRPEVELRTVVVEERRVPATLVLREDVDRALEVGVRGDRTGLHHDLAALDVLALDATQEQTDVVTGLALVEQLAEHLDAGDGGLGRGGTDADDLDLLRHLDDAALDATGHDGATTGDREDVLDGHEERLVDLAHGLGDRRVDGVHELHELVAPLLVALEGLQGGDADHGDVVARELVLGEQLADLELDELQDLLVVDHVGLVQRHDDVGDADLAGQEDVLLRLRHRAVGRRDHQDGAVHLRRTGDHVLDVVGVTGAVDVRVVTLLGLVLDMRDRDRDAAGLLLGRLVDLVEGRRLVQVRVLVVQHLGDRRGQRGLAVVDVPDGADVDVRLRPLELRLRHSGFLSSWLRSGACSGVGSAWVGATRPSPSPCSWLGSGLAARLARSSLRCSLARRLRDDLLGHVARDLGVAVEDHRVARPTLGAAAQIAHVAEHLRERDQGPDDAGAGALLHRLDDPAPGVQVADDVTHVVLGRDDLDGHERLEQGRVGLARGLLEDHRAGDLEGHLRGVHLVVLAVEQDGLDAHHRVAGEDAVLHGVLDAVVDRRDVLPRDATTGDGVLELVGRRVGGDGQRLQGDLDLGELAGPTRLLLVGVVVLLDRPADGLAVGHLGLAHVGLDVELPPHAVDQDLQVQLTHAGDDRLTGLLVEADLERRVLLGQLLDGRAELLLVALGLRLDRDRDDRGREGHRLQDHRLLRVGQGVARRRLLQAVDRHDLAGAHARALLALVGVHLIDLADPLLAVLGAVEHRGPGVEPAGVDADVGELAQVLVGLDLEGQRRERLVLVGVPEDLGLTVERGADDGLDVQRAGQVVGDGVEHGLDALVLERRAGQDRVHLARDRRLADGGLDGLDGDLLTTEVGLHDRVVVLGDALEELLPVLGGLVGQLRGDLLDRVVLAELRVAAPGEGAHLDQVDDADEVGLGADRDLQHQRVGPEALDHHVDAAEEVGTRAVELVDEAHARDAVLLRLPPDLLGLRLDTGNAVVDRDRTVEHPQRPLHLDGEVDVPRGVDDVDVEAVPGALRRGRRDGDAALLLLLHPVHRGGAVVDLTDLVVDAGVEEDPLGRRRLAGVDVRHDPDVAGLGELGHLGHLLLLFFRFRVRGPGLQLLEASRKSRRRRALVRYQR